MGRACRVKTEKGVFTFKDEGTRGFQILPNVVGSYEVVKIPTKKVLRECARSIEVVKLSEETASATKLIREVMQDYLNVNPKASRLYLGRPPIRTHKEAFVLSPLAAANKGYDYLTFDAPEYFKAMSDLRDSLMKASLPGVDQSDLNSLLTNYGLYMLGSNGIRNNVAGVGVNSYKPGFEEIYGEELTNHFKKILELPTPSLVSLKPKVHSSKSLGFYQMDTNGTPIRSEDLKWVSASLGVENSTFSSLYSRRFTAQNKLEFAKMGIPLRSFEWCYTHRKDMFLNAKTIHEGLSLMALPVYLEAFRNNENDDWVNCADRESAYLLNHLDDKDRPITLFERDDRFELLQMNCPKYNRVLAGLTGLPGKKSKLRSMYPGPNNSVTPVFIYLFRLLNKPLEDSEAGFISIEDAKVRKWTEVLKRRQGSKGCCWFYFDFSSAEQVWSDNPIHMAKLYGGLSDLVSSARNAVLNDPAGPRVLLQGTPSGYPGTSSDNLHGGSFENLYIQSFILGLDKEGFRRLLKNRFDGELEYSNGSMTCVSPWGLDDQLCIIYSETMNDRQLLNHVKASIEASGCEGHNIKLEIHDGFRDLRYFGIDINPRQASYSYKGTNLISKITLFEHSKIGDQIGGKFYSRWSLCSNDMKAIIEKVFAENGLIRSTMEEFRPCQDRYLRNLSMMGYNVLEDYNEYNPTERILMGKLLKEEPTVQEVEYPDEVVSTWAMAIKKKIQL